MMQCVSNFLLPCDCTWNYVTIKGDDEQDESSSDHPNTRAATRAKGKGRQRPPGFRFPDPVNPATDPFLS